MEVLLQAGFNGRVSMPHEKRDPVGLPGQDACGTASPVQTVVLNAACPILRSIGETMLAEIVGAVTTLIPTSAVVTDEQGHPSVLFLNSAWCRLAGRAAGPEADPGGTAASGLFAGGGEGLRRSLADGTTADVVCADGMRLFAAPVRLRGEVVGAIGFRYGAPSVAEEPEKLADALSAPRAALDDAARQHQPPPEYMVGIARTHLLTCAELIGQILDRNAIENDVLHYQQNLEALVAQRTAALEDANAQLTREVEDRRRAEHLKDEFVSVVSHELRTPLAITREGISLLLDGIPGPVNERQHKVLGTALGNIDRLARIINDLLDISRIEAGRMAMRRAAVNLSETARQVAASLDDLARRKGLTIQADMPDEPVMVFADADRLVQVLTNLLANAVKFTRAGVVCVSVRRHGTMAECTVKDTGPGIAEEDLPRLFHKFTQLDRTAGGGSAGTGLGLVIAKSIVELHGGAIQAASRLGEGTSIAFTLPTYGEEQVLAGRIDEKIAAARQHEKEFSLFLCDLQYESDPALAGAKREALAKALSALIQTRTFLRRSDALEVRGVRQVLLLADVADPQAGLVLGRFREAVSESLRDVVNVIHVKARFGRAAYPDDGLTAEELLRAAEANLA